MKLIRLILMMLLLLGNHTVFAQEVSEFRSWIVNMKKAPRGPFKQLRWFCNDGTILEPVEYACQDHGGGFQHGEWTDRVKTMRSQGYYIANVYARQVSEALIKNPLDLDMVKQMILEQFLINADDGWIFRQARYYRGALQAEDEAKGGAGILKGLLKKHKGSQERFLLLREAARLLPHYRKNAPISKMRQLSLAIAEEDKNFESLRTKIHVRPEAGDAELVRAYARKKGQIELMDSYEHLGKIIDKVFRPGDIALMLNPLINQVHHSGISEKLGNAVKKLSKETDPFIRFEIVSHLTATLRTHLFQAGNLETMLSVLDTGILLEDELFRMATGLSDGLTMVSIGRSLRFLSQCTDILYGTGLISGRQHKALKNRFANLLQPGKDLFQYRNGLSYVARASDWAEQNLNFNFSMTLEHFQTIEPLCQRYIHDRLHSSLLLIYSQVLQRLTVDNSQQLGIANNIWGKTHASGVNGLNSGLARGVLKEPKSKDDLKKISSNNILILPATISDLPPVAGIVTAGRGNILSHVQLLARNLGIPNVAVDKILLPEIRSMKNKKIVLAVSPKGVVQMAEDNQDWDGIFAQKAKLKRTIISVDTENLDMDHTGFVTLQKIRAKDSGRIAGPKAANLGELKHHFPEAVTDGVVIPFGIFKTFLNQPFEPGGPRMYDWMKDQYQIIKALEDKSLEQKSVIRTTLARIRSWIVNTDPGERFRDDLKLILEKTLGADGSFGVFVRSDTNVEDLPGFTGAGLNLTIPHVVGFENILAAVKRVWASPFTMRSFGWRQAYITNPEHVYASVLLMKTIPVEKSGVLVTKNLETGEKGWLTIAVNEGVGGAVAGQTAEELRVHVKTANVILLSQATEPLKRVVLKEGGMTKIEASGRDTILNEKEIQHLISFTGQLHHRFPRLVDDKGQEVPADVEFGFYKGKLVLFQIRPFLDNFTSLHDQYLSFLDLQFDSPGKELMDLNRIPEREIQ